MNLSSSNIKAKCRAKDPAACKFHGRKYSGALLVEQSAQRQAAQHPAAGERPESGRCSGWWL